MNTDAQPADQEGPAPPSSRRVGPSVAFRTSAGLLLLVVLGLAGLLRYWHSSFGLPYLHYYDEPQTAARAVQILQTGEFDPEFFNYGSLTIYLNAAVDVLHYFHLCGQPDDAVVKIRDIQEVQTSANTPGDHWRFSHPSFLLWNRWLTALFGVIGVGLTYALGKLLVNRGAGLLAAVVLATTALHVHNSVLVTTDVPASTLALGAIVASVVYARGGKGRQIALACLCAGFAASTKYNAGIATLAPLLALAATSLTGAGGFRPFHWASLALTPLAFFVGTPYALFNLPTFLKHAGYEVTHYKVTGHGAKTVEPGWPHFELQAGVVADELGLMLAVLGAVGVLLLVIRRQGWLALAVPLAFAVFMVGTKVNFHRNYLLLYPFLAVGVGATVATVHRLLASAPAPALTRNTLAVVATGAALWLSVSAGAREWKVHHQPETRSQVIDVINRLGAEQGWKSLGIATELKLHEYDLARLQIPYEVVPHTQLFAPQSRYSALLCASEYDLRKRKQNPQGVQQAQQMNARVQADRVIERIEGEPVWLNSLTIDPGIVVLRPR